MAFDFSREWPFFPDDEKLRVFEPRANVAILIGHTEIEIGGQRKSDASLAVLLPHLPATIERGAIAAIGTVATLRAGVERVVQNLLTNPHITVVFLCGEDSPVFTPLEGFACLYRHGVDAGMHVIAGDTTGARAIKVFARDALATISAEEVACLRARSIEIVDCRGAVDPAVFFAAVAARLPEYVRPVEGPSWSFLETIDVYRWRPRVLQVPAGQLIGDSAFSVGHADDASVVVMHQPALVIRATGKSDGRAQRALHTMLRLELLEPGPDRDGRLAAIALATEREVLASEFPVDAQQARLPGTKVVLPAVTEKGRLSPLELDAKGFFMIRVLYEQGALAADYHEGAGRHVETLQAKRAEDLLAAIVAGEYLGTLPAREQHLVYLGVQIARADFALRTGLAFEEGQPLSAAARKNVDHHLYAGGLITGASLEDTWVQGLTGLRERGLLTTTQKGRVAEGWCTLFFVPGMAAIAIPAAYPASAEHIANYADELLAAAPEVRARGDYTYGDRTCHFHYDQIAESGRKLAADRTRLAVNQRWFPDVDLPSTASHRPCLVFDVWFHHGGRLHTLQIARSHDIYGGLPQNALGVARGWGRTLAEATGLPLGDLCFLSISNNFRVGDNADDVRRVIQGGVHAPAVAATLPLPAVRCVAAYDVTDGIDAGAAPIAAFHVESLPARRVGSPAEILAALPGLAERLLRYRGQLDQVATVIERLRTEMAGSGRDHSNSLLLSPRDPLVDREREATPLVCMQLRRQLGKLHAVSVVLGEPEAAWVQVLHDLQRAIGAAADLPLGSATVVRINPTH
jgi:hypothetical protein